MVKKKTKSVCHEIKVPESCCRLDFGEGKYSYSNPNFETVRGEQMIIDFDKEERVIGIELLSSKKVKKRCQWGVGGIGKI